MSLTLELPPPVNEELVQDSQREGVSEMEHAALLVCLASAFKLEDPQTLFQKAVRVFLADNALDAERVFSVFEELVRVCLDTQGTGDLEAPTGKEKTTAAFHTLLRHWRNAVVHQPVAESAQALFAEVPSLGTLEQAQKIAGEAAPEKKVNDSRDHVRTLLAQWQAEDRTPLRTPPPTRAGETPTRALFRKWAEEDADMTEEEKDAEDQLWEDIEKGIKENSLALGTRPSVS